MVKDFVRETEMDPTTKKFLKNRKGNLDRVDQVLLD